MAVQQEEKSIAQLLTDVSDNIARLFREELSLARVETEEKISQTLRAGRWVAAGGLILYISGWTFLAAIILGLATFMPAWAACLLVGVLTGVSGYLVLQSGISRMQGIEPVPELTAQTMRENAEWIRDEFSRRKTT